VVLPAITKSLLTPCEKKKQAQLATANDFLEAADEFERAAGKWRAGDAAKAQRFYARALAAYDEGLGKFPADFDLAFNKYAGYLVLDPSCDVRNGVLWLLLLLFFLLLLRV
jgi:hypothetical protein